MIRDALLAALLALMSTAILLGSGSASAHNSYPYQAHPGYYPANNTSILGQLFGVNQPSYYPNTAYYAGYPGNSAWGQSRKWRNSNWRNQRYNQGPGCRSGRGDGFRSW